MTTQLHTEKAMKRFERSSFTNGFGFQRLYPELNLIKIKTSFMKFSFTRIIILKVARLLCMLFIMIANSLYASAAIFVTTTGSGDHSGTSWANAMNLIEATRVRIANNEYWLQAGTYNDSARSASLNFTSSVYGGFDGTEILRSQRNPAKNVTVIKNFSLAGAYFTSGLNCDGITFMNMYATFTTNSVSNCLFDNSSVISNGPGGNMNSFTDCVFKNGPAVSVQNGISSFTGCIFSDNTNGSQGTGGGGAVRVLSTSTYQTPASGYFYECIFDRNSAGDKGGALSFSNTAGSSVVNCLFKNNSARLSGGAIFAFEGVAGGHSFFQNTFIGNSAPSGSAVALETDKVGIDFFNNIVWGNTGAPSWLSRRNYADRYVVTIRYNLIQDDISSIGDVWASNNIITDPLLNADYTLSACSPAINAGTVDASGRTTDLAGNPRIHSSNPDLGSYEFQGNDPVFASWYADNDDDGFGNPSVSKSACSQPTGYVSNNTDCNDADNTKWQSSLLYADADGDGYTVGTSTSVCYGATIPAGYSATQSGSDCDDNDLNVHATQTWYLDADNDDHYVSSQSSCGSPGAGYNTTATQSGDCDDNDNTKWQSATLYVDADRDGYTVGTATSVCYGTAIPPGYSATSLGSDCNDANALVHATQTWYLDADNDGHYKSSQSSCGSPGAGYNSTATQSGDCNDNDNTKWQSSSLYVDGDGDGYTVGSATSVCYGETIPTGYVAISLGSDCNDANSSVHATQTWYLDADNDGHYVSSQSSCGSPGAGYNTTAIQSGDCDDNDNTKWQSASLYVDADGDGYTVGSATVVCYGATIPAGYTITSLGNDCNDTNTAIHPGAPEIADGVDNNCNGEIDDGFITLSITDTSVNEGNKGKSTMNFTVTLSKASTQKVTVQYATQNGTATAGSDYSSATGTLTFKAGATKQTINISITGDKVAEANETFKANLSNATNATIVRTTGTGTILNDDRATAILATRPQTNEKTIERSVRISPNPASSILHAELYGFVENVTIQLINLQGKVLMQERVQTGDAKFVRQRLSIGNLTNGVYLLVATDGKGNRRTEKVIIAR